MLHYIPFFLQKEIRKHYGEMRFYPREFRSYLLEEIGFSDCELIASANKVKYSQ